MNSDMDTNLNADTNENGIMRSQEKHEDAKVTSNTLRGMLENKTH